MFVASDGKEFDNDRDFKRYEYKISCTFLDRNNEKVSSRKLLIEKHKFLTSILIEKYTFLASHLMSFLHIKIKNSSLNYQVA